MLNEARNLCAGPNLGPTPEFVHGDMRALPFEAAGFDVVWMSALLLHLTRPDAALALAEARRVLRPSVHLYVTVKDGAGEGYDSTGRFYTFWDAAGFAADVRAAGFDLVEEWSSAGEVAWLNIIASPQHPSSTS